MSQLEDIPADLPFRLVSKTIGRGAYASKAIPNDAPSPVFAVKFIHKGYAMRNGRVSAKQLQMEVSLHSHVGHHAHVIEWFASSEDVTWRWIAMEYADGGDLFDKIEADVGVSEDIAHLYFLQLVSGVSFVHSKGVAHRDLKPENILLSSDGLLKIADFGMATMFEYKGQRKGSSTMCGSPPYIAPEIVACGRTPDRRSKYAPDLADLWSCGVILFVLLVGNTPWDEPSDSSWEFQEYVRTSGRSNDALWHRIPADALSLLRGLISVDPQRRFSFARVRQHPWYTRTNRLLAPDGKVLDPLTLATQMLENLHIDFNQRPAATTAGPILTSDDMMILAGNSQSPPPPPPPPKVSSTQPETPINDVAWDWERTPLRAHVSSTQPAAPFGGGGGGVGGGGSGGGGGGIGGSDGGLSTRRGVLPSFLADEPAMSQFSQRRGASMTLTQQARRFRDIVPAESLTRFLSHVPPALLVDMLADALHQLNVPLPSPPAALSSDPDSDSVATLRVKAADGRHQRLQGEIQVDRLRLADGDGELLEVRFVKVVGDPLEWRRFFKKVVVLCKEGVYVPET